MPAHRVAQGNKGRVGGAGVGTATLIDCSGYGSRLRIKTLCCSIAVFANEGLIEITDGTTTHFSWSADDNQGAGKQPPCLNFPDGYDWGDGLDVILKTTNAITMWCIVVAEVRG